MATEQEQIRHLAGICYNAIQQAGISIEVLEARPGLMREMVEAITVLDKDRGENPQEVWKAWATIKATLAALEVKRGN